MKIAKCLLVAVALLAWPTADLLAQAEGATKSNPVTKSTTHPQKQSTTVAVHTTKPKPAPKAEKIPKASSANTSWVPGDYYYDGNDWQWADGYWLDNPWAEATWIPGHWSDRFWGWTWVPGYWG